MGLDGETVGLTALESLGDYLSSVSMIPTPKIVLTDP